MTGAQADAYTIWITQWVGQEIRVLDYYESSGQVLAFHVNWMREHGYGKAINTLPHGGVNTSTITGKTYAEHWRDAGFTVEPPVKNDGRGAAMMRIEALRRLGPQLWFNEATTEAGRDALGFYHEKKDDVRNIGLGPEHDWSSHAADALGLDYSRVEVVQPDTAHVPNSGPTVASRTCMIVGKLVETEFQCSKFKEVRLVAGF